MTAMVRPTGPDSVPPILAPGEGPATVWWHRPGAAPAADSSAARVASAGFKLNSAGTELRLSRHWHGDSAWPGRTEAAAAAAVVV